MKSNLTAIFTLLMAGAFSACAVDSTDPQEALETTSQALEANQFGFAWSHQLTGTFNPYSNYAANTGGGPITIENVSTGQYKVTFAGLGGPGGNAQVVAYGEDNTRCKVESWFQVGSNEQVKVLCHTPTGFLINSRFVVRYGRHAIWSSSPSAYLWADQSSAASSTPSPMYSFNSTGAVNTITRASTGRYIVNLPGLGGINGNVLVTAHGNSSSHCIVESWKSYHSYRPIVVMCWSTAGARTDSTFSLAFDGAGVTGFSSLGAFAWANNPLSASYIPDENYSYHPGPVQSQCTTDGSITAGRLSTGYYFMNHFGQPAFDSTVHVTARNEVQVPDYCKVESWNALQGGIGVQIKIRCFNWQGAATNSEYLESYYTSHAQQPC